MREKFLIYVMDKGLIVNFFKKYIKNKIVIQLNNGKGYKQLIEKEI